MSDESSTDEEVVFDRTVEHAGLTLAWGKGQGEHPEKGVIEIRVAMHPELGQLLLFPINTMMGMWVLYVASTETQHFLGVFGEGQGDKTIPEGLWLEAMRQSHGRLSKD